MNFSNFFESMLFFKVSLRLPEGVEAPDLSNGEVPELPEGVEAPDTTSGTAPQGGKPGQMPGSMDNGAVPGMIDFDAMATNNVISAETLEKIKAYMEANKPADLPETNGQAPEMNGEALEEGTNLLDELLENEIITQAEYDALTAALATEDTTK